MLQLKDNTFAIVVREIFLYKPPCFGLFKGEIPNAIYATIKTILSQLTKGAKLLPVAIPAYQTWRQTVPLHMGISGGTRLLPPT